MERKKPNKICNRKSEEDKLTGMFNLEEKIRGKYTLIDSFFTSAAAEKIAKANADIPVD